MRGWCGLVAGLSVVDCGVEVLEPRSLLRGWDGQSVGVKCRPRDGPLIARKPAASRSLTTLSAVRAERTLMPLAIFSLPTKVSPSALA